MTAPRRAFLRQVAALHIAETAKGNLRPNRAIADSLGANRRTVESWVAQARLLGLIPSTDRGRAMRRDVPRDVLDLVDDLVRQIERDR